MIVARNILGFSITQNMQRIMSANGFYASVMKAEKQTSNTSKLPKGVPIPVLPVDYLVNKPDFWIGGEGSYVCPIESDWALWFNWTMNNSNTAVLSSVKGMNPITGQRINGIGLEKYQNKCPVHNCDFLHGKFCPECNFKWPDQNYISKPNPMYLDGFRSADGTVRQFYFTEDMTKSIPELVIGKEDTVPAFGFCFYKLKKDNRNYESGNRLRDIPKIPVVQNFSSVIGLSRDLSADHVDGRLYTSKALHSKRFRSGGDVLRSANVSYTSSVGEIKYSAPVDSVRAFYSSSCETEYLAENSARSGIICPPDSSVCFDSAVNEVNMNAEVGIGAGVQIKQSFISDKREIQDWSEKPAGIIRVYFVFREQFEMYASSGLRELTGYKEGYLANLPVGGKNE